MGPSCEACSQLEHDIAAPVRVTIVPSTQWLAADLQQLGSLVQQRNRFVCQQLVTMAREQLAIVAAAGAEGDERALHAAALTFLATVACACNSHVLAAGLFRVRAGASGTATEAQECLPHVYVELVACNSPGRGLGTRLLQAIEAFVSERAAALSAGCACGDGDVQSPGQVPREPHNDSVVQQQQQQQEQRGHCPDPVPALGGAAATGHNDAPSRLSGIRLLSVASAQGFYARCGYALPDAAREMFKPLHALHHHGRAA